MSGISQKARAHPLINPKRFFARELLIFECIYPSWEGTHFQSGLKIGRSEAADFQPGASRIENDKRFSTRSFVHWKSAASDRSIFNPNWKWYFVLCFRDTRASGRPGGRAGDRRPDERAGRRARGQTCALAGGKTWAGRNWKEGWKPNWMNWKNLNHHHL